MEINTQFLKIISFNKNEPWSWYPQSFGYQKENLSITKNNFFSKEKKGKTRGITLLVENHKWKLFPYIICYWCWIQKDEADFEFTKESIL